MGLGRRYRQDRDPAAIFARLRRRQRRHRQLPEPDLPARFDGGAMKIRILTPEYPPAFGGGVATFYQALAPAYAAAGHSVEVIQGSAVFCSSNSPKRRRDGVDIHTLE